MVQAAARATRSHLDRIAPPRRVDSRVAPGRSLSWRSHRGSHRRAYWTTTRIGVARRRSGRLRCQQLLVRRIVYFFHLGVARVADLFFTMLAGLLVDDRFNCSSAADYA